MLLASVGFVSKYCFFDVFSTKSSCFLSKAKKKKNKKSWDRNKTIPKRKLGMDTKDLPGSPRIFQDPHCPHPTHLYSTCAARTKLPHSFHTASAQLQRSTYTAYTQPPQHSNTAPSEQVFTKQGLPMQKPCASYAHSMRTHTYVCSFGDTLGWSSNHVGVIWKPSWPHLVLSWRSRVVCLPAWPILRPSSH